MAWGVLTGVKFWKAPGVVAISSRSPALRAAAKRVVAMRRRVCCVCGRGFATMSAGDDSTLPQLLVCRGPSRFRQPVTWEMAITLSCGSVIGLAIALYKDGFTPFRFIFVAGGLAAPLGIWFIAAWTFWRYVRDQKIVFDAEHRMIIFTNFVLQGDFLPHWRRSEVVVPFEEIRGYRLWGNRDGHTLYILTEKGQLAVRDILDGFDQLVAALEAEGFGPMPKRQDPKWRGRMLLIVGIIMAVLIMWLVMWLGVF